MRNGTESCNWLNQRRHRILCALVSNGNFTELDFTDLQIKKLSWVSETEWLNQYHSMLLSNSPRTLLVETASTSVRDMTGLAPPRVFSPQNKKRSIIVSCHFVSVCSFGKKLLVKKWVDIEFMFSLLTRVFPFMVKICFSSLSTSKFSWPIPEFCIARL